MLNPDWLINNLDDITVLTSDFTTAVLTSIAKHVSDSLRVQPEKGIMPSTRRQIESAQAAGLLREDIEREVARYLNLAIPEVRALFEDAAVANLSYENKVLKEAGLPEIIYRQSPTMQRIVHAGATKEIGNLQRLTGVFTAQAAEKMSGMLETIYRRENIAYLQTVSGVESYVSAMNQAMDSLVRDGIPIYDYASGRSIQIESAILRDIRTGIALTAAEMTKQAAIERGVDHVEVSAHQGARNKDVAGRPWANHESFQGKVYKVNSWE